MSRLDSPFLRRRRPAPAPMSAPWPMSERPDPVNSVPNEPTEAGRLLGGHLARLADVAEDEQRKDFPDMAPRCTDCAFRAGTLPNGCEETLMDAIKCVVESLPFYCHKGLREGEKPRRLCSGAMVLYTGEAAADLRTFVRGLG